MTGLILHQSSKKEVIIDIPGWAQGVWVAMVTPWDPKVSSPRPDTIQALIDRFSSVGIDGLFILGMTGEGTLLSPQARMRYAGVVLEQAKGRLPVIVHTGHDRPSVARELSHHARDAGASAVAITAPTRYRLDDEELAAHFLLVAEALDDFPLFLYDIPSATGNPLSADLLANIRKKSPNVVGVKVSRADWGAWEEYLAIANDVALFIGKDEMAFPLLLLGGRGLVCGGANIFPELYVTLYRSVQQGELSEGKYLQSLINRLCHLCHQGSPLAFTKEAVTLMGWDVGPPLPPLRTLRVEERVELERGLTSLKEEMAQFMSRKEVIVGENSINKSILN